MTGWAPRRFWSAVRVGQEAAGWAVLLDERPIKTPGRASLLSPTEALAAAVAAEWEAQTEEIRPETMPFTRALNSAIDKVAPDPGPVADMLAGYAETDLLCYRATHPEELIERQDAAWDPYLDWAAEAYGARLEPVFGVMPAAQDAAALDLLRRAVHRLDPHALTALHEVVTLTGSLVLGLAGLEGRVEPGDLWRDARIDELWQAEQWGADAEAEAAAAAREAAVKQALRFYALSRRPA
ncbi:MAG: ATP12 family protein [Paracoccaceae bacterium]|nr:ATP12 family protein [Paracoccaceae bacterium]